MGFLGSLGKIAGFLPIPGANYLSKGLEMAGDMGSVLGGQQGGKNNALAAQSNLQGQHDRNAIDLFQARQQAENQAAQTDLQRKGFEQHSRGTNARDAMIGMLLGGGITPTSLAGGKASGGLLRSLNGNPEALAAMKMLGSQASGAQASPLAFEGGKMMAAPTLSAMPKMDTGGGLLGNLTKIAQLAGAASPYLQGGQQGGPMSEVPTAGLDPRFLKGKNAPMEGQY